jgi:hypothetical protein
MANSENDEVRKRRAEDHLEKLLLAGLKSGNAVEANEEFWERQQQRIRDRAQAKSGQIRSTKHRR